MDTPILQKTIIIFVLILWVINEVRGKKKKRYDSAIAEANARERHEWRYLRWGWQAIQVAAAVYIFVQLIQFLLR
ncbi:hypothetical protein ACV6DN_18920 [Enterobacter asburiae]|uniref:hypothetical protein n=1 Tax=Enterobacter TaxID=547 RepID=UPI000EB43372|nr:MULTISPECIES: hypothetical protein [Enterobacter]ELH8607870.1 hypothetical protein [Enterobacter asburiae]MCS5455442.1 hypothetical protein [Enterobacter asburiae]UUR70648.1 hypothetical protein NQ230_12550 [Enterobacter asburiae]HCT3169512.1 hypothetical protein [Enterobacter asburiae]HCT3173181.1 hypothetical protein [Enterobacter asburiae]